MRRDAEMDRRTKIRVAEKRGADQTKLEVAKGFKQDGSSPDIIAKNTGLSLQEIAKL